MNFLCRLLSSFLSSAKIIDGSLPINISITSFLWYIFLFHLFMMPNIAECEYAPYTCIAVENNVQWFKFKFNLIG